jgi:hypothetical protein
MSTAAQAVTKPRPEETAGALSYRSVIDAVRVIGTSMRQLREEEALGFTVSPAWRLLSHAEDYLLRQANAVLRGEQ